MLLEIYHLFLIDKDIYQQPKEKADGKKVRHGQLLHLGFDVLGHRQSHCPSYWPKRYFSGPDY